MAEGAQASLLIDEAGHFVGISVDGDVYRLETSSKTKNVAGTFINPATEGKQDDAITKLTSIDGKDFATQTTLATLATETKLEAVRVLLASLDGKDFATQTTLAVLAGKDFATQTTLATLATETKLEAVRVLLASLDGKDFATQTTLASIKDTDGIKKIADPVAVTDNGGSLTIDSEVLFESKEATQEVLVELKLIRMLLEILTDEKVSDTDIEE